jgi:hypothetical protein
MKKWFSRLLLAAWSFIGVPVLYGIFIWLLYWDASFKGGAPWAVLPKWLWDGVSGFIQLALLLSGLYCFIIVLIKILGSFRFKVVAIIFAGAFYLTIISIIMFLIGAIVAFFWGDSL